MIYKTRPVYSEEYGFDDTPLEVTPFVWCLLTIARLWMAFAFISAIIVGTLLLVVGSPVWLPIAGALSLIPSKIEEPDWELKKENA